MSTVILACTTLSEYVQAAQETMGTSFPLVEVDRKYHVEPKDMRTQVLKTIESLSPEVDTVLVAMGFCGGSWQDVVSDRRIVIPRVDDCVTMVMTTEDKWNPNLKEAGHMYLFGEGLSGFSIEGIYQDLRRQYDEEMADMVFEMYFENYHHLDIVDTGLYDCYDLAYVEKAQAEADRIEAEIDYVPGSNHLLEKLVSGRWDEQFLVVEPGKKMIHGMFFE